MMVFAAAMSTGCGSAAEALCAKNQECSQGTTTSYEQCVETSNTLLRKAQEKNTAQCNDLAAAYERLLGCQAGLTCEELRAGSGSQRCAAELERYLQLVFDGGSSCII
jgi:hypothetical protein